MRILGLDTATDLGTVALVEREHGTDRLLAEASASVDSRHGETLLPHVVDVLARGGTRPAELGLIAVGIGPGSFTGVRVGLATAKGLSLALSVPLIGVSTLDVVAAASPGEQVLVLLDAKKDEVFWALYQRHGGALVRVGEPAHGAHAEVAARVRAQTDASLVVVGRGARDPRFVLAPSWTLADPALDLPAARVLAALGATRFASEGPSDRAALVPLYVRSADAVVPASMLLASRVGGPAKAIER